MLAILVACLAQVGPPSSFEYVRDRVIVALDTLERDGDYSAAQRNLQDLFDQCAAYVPLPGSTNALERSDWALRMVSQLGAAPAATRRTLLPYLRQHRDLAEMVAFSLVAKDNAGEAYSVLDKLVQAFGEDVARHRTLAAAVCVVYDRPRPAGAFPSAKDRKLIDPVMVFGHFVRNYDKLAIKPDDLPTQTLVYVVDTQAAPAELNWALMRFSGDPDPAARYAEVPADKGVYRMQHPRKVLRGPYTLENISRLGGIPEDNAYYAAHVAKAAGIPATVIAGRSGKLTHARVGYMRPKDSSWNLDIGRVNDFENAQGELTDPQTGDTITDSDLVMTAARTGGDQSDRYTVVAVTDMTRRIAELDQAGNYPPPALAARDALPTPRPAGAEAAPGMGPAPDRQLAVPPRFLGLDPGRVRGHEPRGPRRVRAGPHHKSPRSAPPPPRPGGTHAGAAPGGSGGNLGARGA
jgi:hypothetical protein